MAAVLVSTPLFLPSFGIKEPLISYGLYGLAFVDICMAFVLPAVIEKQSMSEYLFYEDRLEIKMQQGRIYSLPYDNISSIEAAGTPRDAEHGLTSVRLETVMPANIPFFGIGKTVLLPSLAEVDAPCARIKEVVEKSRRA